jgi:hypothetical protein
MADAAAGRHGAHRIHRLPLGPMDNIVYVIEDAAPESTSMAEQRWGNPFLHFDAEAAFVAFRAEHNRHRLPPYQPVPPRTPAW